MSDEDLTIRTIVRRVIKGPAESRTSNSFNENESSNSFRSPEKIPRTGNRKFVSTRKAGNIKPDETQTPRTLVRQNIELLKDIPDTSFKLPTNSTPKTSSPKTRYDPQRSSTKRSQKTLNIQFDTLTDDEDVKTTNSPVRVTRSSIRKKEIDHLQELTKGIKELQPRAGTRRQPEEQTTGKSAEKQPSKKRTLNLREFAEGMNNLVKSRSPMGEIQPAQSDFGITKELRVTISPLKHYGKKTIRRSEGTKSPNKSTEALDLHRRSSRLSINQKDPSLRKDTSPSDVEYSATRSPPKKKKQSTETMVENINSNDARSSRSETVQRSLARRSSRLQSGGTTFDSIQMTPKKTGTPKNAKENRSPVKFPESQSTDRKLQVSRALLQDEEEEPLPNEAGHSDLEEMQIDRSPKASVSSIKENQSPGRKASLWSGRKMSLSPNRKASFSASRNLSSPSSRKTSLSSDRKTSSPQRLSMYLHTKSQTDISSRSASVAETRQKRDTSAVPQQTQANFLSSIVKNQLKYSTPSPKQQTALEKSLNDIRDSEFLGEYSGSSREKTVNAADRMSLSSEKRISFAKKSQASEQKHPSVASLITSPRTSGRQVLSESRRSVQPLVSSDKSARIRTFTLDEEQDGSRTGQISAKPKIAEQKLDYVRGELEDEHHESDADSDDIGIDVNINDSEYEEMSEDEAAPAAEKPKKKEIADPHKFMQNYTSKLFRFRAKYSVHKDCIDTVFTGLAILCYAILVFVLNRYTFL